MKYNSDGQYWCQTRSTTPEVPSGEHPQIPGIRSSEQYDLTNRGVFLADKLS